MSEIERAARANQRATELSAQTSKEDQEKQTILEKQKAAAENAGGVIQWNSRELLIENDGKEVVVGGLLRDLEPSSTGKTLYLLFSEKSDKKSARGAIVLKGAPEELTMNALAPLKGKKLRLHGKVEVLKISKTPRPEIQIKDRASIQMMD